MGFYVNTFAVISIVLSSAAVGHAENHFILELTGGLASDAAVDNEVDSGTAASATFGIGGRIPGQSPAYYFIARVGRAEFGYKAGHPYAYTTVNRQQRDWALGGRAYLPITSRLRVVAQIAVGETIDDASVTRSGSNPLALASSTFSIFTQAGIQFRVTEKFALGLAADIAIYPAHEHSNLAARADYVGTNGEIGRTQLGATGTFHF
jgi:hypothetical protein